MKSQNRTWLTVIVLIRVFISLGIMMALFLGMWIGYFTLPLILIGIFSILLAISDIGILVSLRNAEKSFWKNFQKNRLENDHSSDENTLQ
ncbi:MAG: hypothetical protein K8R40_05905 [Anaerolineaceae bacterium]|nr:hypothetical protein [Anaerolineaceae bacterium]